MPLKLQNIEDILGSELTKHPNVRPEWARAVMNAESGGNPFAVSPAGAEGLFQLMPGTAKDLGVTDPFDPLQNVRGGLTYLDQLSQQFGGDERAAAAAYNAGPGNVNAWMKKGWTPDQPPPVAETRNYLTNISSKIQGGMRGSTFARAMASPLPDQPPPPVDPYADYADDPNMSMLRMAFPNLDPAFHKNMYHMIFGPAQPPIDMDAIMAQQQGMFNQAYPEPTRPEPTSKVRKGFALGGDVLSGLGRAYQATHRRPGQEPVEPTNASAQIQAHDEAEMNEYEKELQQRGLIGAQMTMAGTNAAVAKEMADRQRREETGQRMLDSILDYNAALEKAGGRTTGSDIDNIVPNIANVLQTQGQAAALDAASRLVGPEKGPAVVAMAGKYFERPDVAAGIASKSAFAANAAARTSSLMSQMERARRNAAKFGVFIDDTKMTDYWIELNKRAAGMVPSWAIHTPGYEDLVGNQLEHLMLPFLKEKTGLSDEQLQAEPAAPGQVAPGGAPSGTPTPATQPDATTHFLNAPEGDPDKVLIQKYLTQLGVTTFNPNDAMHARMLRIATLMAKRDRNAAELAKRGAAGAAQ